MTKGSLRARVLVAWLSVVPLWLLAGCAQQSAAPEADASAPAELSVPSVADDPAEDYLQQVVVTEGTNMAATVGSDGRLVISLQGTLFQGSINTRTTQAITNYYQDAREPSLHPTSGRVVYHGYASGTWDIWALDSSGAAPVPLTQGPYDDREPVFSRNGEFVAFASDRSGSYDLWTLKVASGELRQITRLPGNAYSPSFDAKDTNLVFAYEAQPGEAQVSRVDLATAELETLHEEAGRIQGVSMNPVGDKVAFQLQTRDANGPVTQLKLYDLKTETARSLSGDGADVFPFRASWLTNRELVYTTDGGITRLRLDTAGKPLQQARVPFTAAFTLSRKPYQRRARNYAPQPKPVKGIVGPVISADGAWLAFTALGDLWRSPIAGGDAQNLTNDPFAESQAVFSAANNSLYYLSDRPVPGHLSAAPSTSSVTLWRVDLDSMEHRPVGSRLQNLSHPSPSPDGQHMAAFVPVPGNPLGGQLVLLELASGNIQRLGQPVPPGPISWSADGQQLASTVLNRYSSRYREGIYEVVLFDRETGKSSNLPLVAHRSPLNLSLLPAENGVSFVQGGQLYKALLNETGDGFLAPERMVSGLVDAPSWQADGSTLVFSRGGSVMRLALTSGAIEDVTPALSFTRHVPTQRWTLRAGRLVVGLEHKDTARYLWDRDIVINGNRIEAIVPRSGDSPEPIVDAADHTVIPGLFEMHAHLGGMRESLGRTWLAYGITSVRDPGAEPYTAKARQEAWDAAQQVGPRTHITGHLTDGNRVYYAMAEGLTDANQLNFALQRTALLDLDFIKTYVRFPDSLQAKVVAFAHERGIPVSSHEIFPAAAMGMDHVEHIGGTSRRGYQPKVSALGNSYQDVVALLAASGMGITATAVLPGFALTYANDATLFTSPQFQGFYGQGTFDGYAPLMQRLGASATRVVANNGNLLRALVQQDALLVTGTDSPFSPYGTGLHAEFRLYEAAGLSAAQVLRSATFKSAQAAGVSQELGSIEVGKLADLVVVDGDPLEDTADWDNVVATVKGGTWHDLQSLLQVPAAAN